MTHANGVQDPRSPVKLLMIDEEMAGQRIDNFLLARLKGVPKTHIYRLLRKGEVRVNKGRIKPEYRLKSGDQVRIPPIRLGDEREPAKASANLINLLEAAILFEDEGLMVINKPAGLAVHGGSGVSLGLIEALRQIRPLVKHLELVHRLDRDTSGCVLVAKKRSVLTALHTALRDGAVEKIYYTLVVGKWPAHKKEVEAPLIKNVLSSGERMVKVDREGKLSKTLFRILTPFAEATLLAASPITGRTHQIRVHAKYAGHPIVGDEKYGEVEANRQMKQQFGIDRLFLHAASLRFVLPTTGEEVFIEAPLGDKLSSSLARMSL